jgi:hypothetical protein
MDDYMLIYIGISVLVCFLTLLIGYIIGRVHGEDAERERVKQELMEDTWRDIINKLEAGHE